MEQTTFSSWNEISDFIQERTGCIPFPGEGIGFRKRERTCILRSVDGTYYYNDNLEDIENVSYTLYGGLGDQDIEESRFNEPLMNPLKTEHIYLYRVRGSGRNKSYIWYGKYEIITLSKEDHVDKNQFMRKILVLVLRKISD